MNCKIVGFLPRLEFILSPSVIIFLLIRMSTRPEIVDLESPVLELSLTREKFLFSFMSLSINPRLCSCIDSCVAFFLSKVLIV